MITLHFHNPAFFKKKNFWRTFTLGRFFFGFRLLLFVLLFKVNWSKECILTQLRIHVFHFKRGRLWLPVLVTEDQINITQTLLKDCTRQHWTTHFCFNISGLLHNHTNHCCDIGHNCNASCIISNCDTMEESSFCFPSCTARSKVKVRGRVAPLGVAGHQCFTQGRKPDPPLIGFSNQ